MTRKQQKAYDEALKRIAACRRGRGMWLDLGSLGLTRLPAEIGQLDKLTLLRADDNQLSTLPPEIGQLAKLTELNLESNQLSTLPPEVGQLVNLTRLYLDTNQLSTLPTTIGQLVNLTRLVLSNNRLSTLPPEIGQLTKLTAFYLFNNQLSALPPGIGELTKLPSLDLSRNRLSALPPEIGQLANLKVLGLSDNRLNALPPEIGQLVKLPSIDLSRNQLSTLPPEIGRLTQLERLILENNALRELPESLKRLVRLRELTLHGNDALGVPTEVLGPTHATSGSQNPPAKPQEILDYYFAALGDRGQPLREMKVLVVGRGAVGKTSVIRRLKGLPLDKLQPETHGIVIEQLSLPCADGAVAARVWDFGGQHVLHAMHEFFFTGRSLYVVVLGEREDMAERDAEYWLQLIRSYAGAAPVIVVLNKSGGRARELELPRRKLEDTYGPILAWVPTECLEADLEKGGIATLKRELTSAVGGMPEIKARFPKKWILIKDCLSRMKESYLDYATYAARCAKLGETDPKKQEELAAFLHDLGVALNYSRDPRLHETTVLRPDWLADGIYALLRANDRRHPHPLAQDGRITLARMPAIYAAAERLEMLKAAHYPKKKHPFLLRLMAAFQLSFPLNEAGTEHLVPALLPLEEPAESPSHLLDKAVLELRWEFPVVPAPLLPRLLVRTLGLVMDKWRWRRGAIYAFGPAVAKVWEEKERYIYLSAAERVGEPPKEAVDDLVRMIRGSLREAVAEYKNLKVQEQLRWRADWLPRRAAESLGICEPDDKEGNLSGEEQT